METIDTLIIGAGIAGLAFSRAYNKSSVIIEGSDVTGGKARSYEHDGFTFDIGGHYLHGDVEFLKSINIDLSKFSSHDRNAQVLLGDQMYEYPIQSCKELSSKKALPLDGVKKGSLREYYVNEFGNLAWSFFIPYNEKVFRCSTNDMIPFHYTSQRNPKGKGYNNTFLYSNTGRGSQELVDQLAEGASIRYNQRLEAVDISNKIATMYDGCTKHQIQYNKLIYTGSLSSLPYLVGKQLPVTPAVNAKAVNMYVVNLVVKNIKEKFKDVNWVYLPDSNIPLFRVGFYNRVNPREDGLEAMYLELSYSGEYDESHISEELLEKLLSDLGIIDADEAQIVTYSIVPVKDSYPIISDPGFADNLNELIDTLASEHIYLTGRYALWKWSGMLETMKDATELATELSQ